MKMKKLLFIAIAAVSLLAGAVSCSKTSVVVLRYGFDNEEFGQLRYAPGHEADVSAFIADLNAVTNRFDGTEFTENEIVSAYDAVVARHNNKYISGTFSLYRFDPETGEKLAKAKTWTMRFEE